MTHFTHPAARDYSNYLTSIFGSPTQKGYHVVGWENLYDPYVSIYVKDEFIYHDFPAEHHDFVYSTAKIPLTPKIACSLLKVSGSILPDLLKNEVTARCGGLTANDVTLSFAKDVVEGLVSPTKEEYARRIKNKIVTRKEFDSYLIGPQEEERCVML